MIPKQVKRLMKYSVSGGLTFGIDIVVLALLVEVFSLYYLAAVSFSYIFAVSINYTINKKWGFKETETKFFKGYCRFFVFAIICLLLTVVLMKLFVDYMQVYYIFSRIIVATVVGFVNFGLNYVFTFRMGNELVFWRN